MTVRAIFYVDELSMRPGRDADDEGRPIGDVKLRAAAKGPYRRWAKWTPSGELTLGTVNADAFEWFRQRLGTDVAISFEDPTEADLTDE
jgi:hypothetical protein